ncbi:hypothetical protein BP6252_11388 [Coleophoma cylindrospora]|uniref:Uncharacterized protein n=1 Tax=Coleophoma cylindrospora TaxID=1849047 RepID=A0A3D8QJH1_9HELO|nr:hypothetical protein BP6252_11388 [Coleophoma cylindrospora]
MLRGRAFESNPWLIRTPENFSPKKPLHYRMPANSTECLNQYISGKKHEAYSASDEGVSYFFIQERKSSIQTDFALSMGSNVIVASSTDIKLQISEKLGTSELIKYTATPAKGDEIIRLTDEERVDLVTSIRASGTMESL